MTAVEKKMSKHPAVRGNGSLKKDPDAEWTENIQPKTTCIKQCQTIWPQSTAALRVPPPLCVQVLLHYQTVRSHTPSTGLTWRLTRIAFSHTWFSLAILNSTVRPSSTAFGSFTSREYFPASAHTHKHRPTTKHWSLILSVRNVIKTRNGRKVPQMRIYTGNLAGRASCSVAGVDVP